MIFQNITSQRLIHAWQLQCKEPIFDLLSWGICWRNSWPWQQLRMSTREQCKVSKQAKVPGSRFLIGDLSGGSDILLSLSLFLQVRTRTKKRTGRKHDMGYSCFRPWWYEILLFCYGLFAEVLLGGKKAEYFERFCWEYPLRCEERLSIFAGLPGHGG